MDAVTRVQTMDEAAYISHNANKFEKSMHSTILP